MFVNLYKLSRKTDSKRTSFEDFNTESFAGVLKMSPQILNSFVDFLKLPAGKYKVSTQVYYSLSNTNNCVVDMVLKSDTTVCFIENKVNSEEGWEQLSRYAQVLTEYYNNDDLENRRTTHLRYCTKNVDIKTVIDHDFFQFRWFQVGQLIAENHPSDVLGMNYLKFLQHHKMALDASITTDTVVSLKNYFSTYDTIKYHLDESARNFKRILLFSKGNLVKKSKPEIQNELLKHKRLSNSIKNPLVGSVYSEILYSIDFEEVRLQTQIWIRKDHSQMDAVKKAAENSGCFEFIESNEWGLGLRNRTPLYSFIDNPNADNEIKSWFEQSFKKIRVFIDTTPELEWNEHVKNVGKK